LSRVAGISAAAAGRWEEANAHFDRAWEECQRLPNLIERPFVLCWRGWMLARRGGQRDEQRSRELLAESRARLRELGIDPRLIPSAVRRAR
jgi:hypothetical protein